jgi:hypothetical protein
MSIIPLMEPIFIEPVACDGLFCTTTGDLSGGPKFSATLEHGHMVELQEISVAKVGADIRTEATRRNTQAGRKFMMESHCTPRYEAREFSKKWRWPKSRMKPLAVVRRLDYLNSYEAKKDYSKETTDV